MADGFAKDYIQVNERIIAFYAKFPDGSLQSEIVELNPDRVVMRAYAYRTPDDQRPGIGYSSLEIPGRTPYTRGSEVENCETSAWGRAIAALGFEVKRGIASAEEVRNKSGSHPQGPSDPPPVDGADGALVGKIETAKGFDEFLPKPSPEGGRLEFKLRSGRGGIKVVAEGKLAYDLAMEKDDVLGATASCWGTVKDQSFKPKGSERAITYQVLELDRIKVGPLELPKDEPIGEEPPADVPLFGEVA